MTYITTTIINLEKEPDAYHTKEDEFEYYSVHISYEINPTNGCDEILIKEQYFDWLKELSNLKFYVFNADGDSKKYKQSGENVEVIYPPENDTICDNNQIKKWIDNNISNIVSSRDTVKYELEISDNDKPIFTIADLLKSSAQWPAPLPHKACLKKIVKIPSTIAKNSILVAFSKQITSLPILKPDSNGNGMNETTYCFYVENNSNERFYTEIIPKVKSAAKESYPNTLSDIGFFQLNEEAHRDYLVLKLINERSPHALNTLEALLDIKESDLKQILMKKIKRKRRRLKL